MKVGAVRGFGFGPDITESFLALNKLSLIIRSHEWCDAGYHWMHDKKCVTVFSAANYCGDSGNAGAVVVFRFALSMEPHVVQFKAAHYPVGLPAPLVTTGAAVTVSTAPQITTAVAVPPPTPMKPLDAPPPPPPHSPQTEAREMAYHTPATPLKLQDVPSPVAWVSAPAERPVQKGAMALRSSSPAAVRKATHPFAAWLRAGPRSPPRYQLKKKVC
jgi:hypothetical protein